ncbi:MAG: cytochrome B [Flavobacteriales bacterium]|nr:cytochrome B [Flavobacteriales bacterium]MCB9363743.1 cytochrome B [Flavobacteriales bacterium]
MYNGMLHAHSGLRWLVLIFLLLAVIKSFAGWFGKKDFNKSDNLIALLLLSFTHTQMIVGIILYFISSKVVSMGDAMKDSVLRFWAMEHGVTMLIAITLITIGRVKSKKAETSELKFKKGAIFYTIALVLILWAGLIKPSLLGAGLF